MRDDQGGHRDVGYVNLVKKAIFTSLKVFSMADKKKAVAKAVQQPASTEAAAPSAPGLGSMGRQFVLLPALWASHKVNWEDPITQSYLLAAFGVVVLCGFLALQTTLSRIAKARDSSRVANPGEGPYMANKAEDGTVSAAEYDSAKVKEFKMQFMMSCGMVTFLHVK